VLAVCLLLPMLAGCASDKAVQTAQSRNIPPASTIVPCESVEQCEPEPRVTRQMDLGEIGDRWRAAFDRANCRLEIARRNVDSVAAALKGDQKRSFIQGLSSRKKPKTDCERLRATYLLEVAATAGTQTRSAR